MKMMNKETEQRQAIELLCTDMLVPKEHLLRKIDAAVDFTHIYDLVETLYSEDNGRPSIDSVVLYKLVLIQHLFGIRSLRQTMRDVEVNVAYRWFLGYTMSQPLPHFATISYAFRHRFTAEVIEGVFRWVLEEVARAGYLSPEVVFVDGTHIKANANLKKHVKKSIPKAAKHYQEQLMKEVDADRAAHGKKPLKKDDDDDDTPSAPPEEKTVIESTTDPECGVFHKGEHKKCFAYEAHTVCEKRGYVLEVEVTPGNVHDSVAFDPVFQWLIEHYPEVEVVTADAGYKTPWICKQVIDSGRTPSLPYKRPMTKKGNLPWYEYVYDEYYDCVLCPSTRCWNTPRPTATATGNTRARATSARTARFGSSAHRTSSVSRRSPGMSGRITLNRPRTSGIRRWAKRPMRFAPKPLNASLPTPKKNTLCVTHPTEGLPPSRPGSSSSLLRSTSKSSPSTSGCDRCFPISYLCLKPLHCCAKWLL